MQKQIVKKKPSLHRRLYDWVLSFAHSKFATPILFCLSFAESSFFPIAPDILQIPLTLERPKKVWFYATVNTIASVLGGIFGYFIGFALWHLTSEFFFTHIFSEKIFSEVDKLYHTYDVWVILIAAFTPIPYKIFTIGAGVFEIPLGTFILASIVGRAARFFLVATLLWKWGAHTKLFIEKYFNILTLLFVILIATIILLLRYFHV